MVKDIPDWDAAVSEAMIELGHTVIMADAHTGTTPATEMKLDRVIDWKDLKTHEQVLEVMAKAVYLLLRSKYAKYSPKNIIQSYEPSDVREANLLLYARLKDKMARIRSSAIDGVDLGKEGKMESYGDMAGYGLIGLMVELQLFGKPMEESK